MWQLWQFFCQDGVEMDHDTWMFFPLYHGDGLTDLAADHQLWSILHNLSHLSHNHIIVLHKVISILFLKNTTRMWANAQCDGRPAEYRWRSLFNAAKFGWRPLLQCHAVTLPRRETHWNWQGCPKLPDRSQPLVGRSSSYCGDMWRRYCCLTAFFRLSISALVENI